MVITTLSHVCTNLFRFLQGKEQPTRKSARGCVPIRNQRGTPGPPIWEANKDDPRWQRDHAAAVEHNLSVSAEFIERTGGSLLPRAQSKAKGPTSRSGRFLQANKNLAGTTPLSPWVSYGKDHLEAAQQSGIQVSSEHNLSVSAEFIERTGGSLLSTRAQSKAKGPTSRSGRLLQANKNLAGTTPLSPWVSYGKDHLEAAQQSGIQVSSAKRKQTGGAFAGEDSDSDSVFYSDSEEEDGLDSDEEDEPEEEPEEEEEEEAEEQPEDPVSPEKPKKKGKAPRKPRKKRVLVNYFDPLFEGAVPEMQTIADEKKAASPGIAYDYRNITIKNVYDVLDSVLTWDSTKTLVDNGVYFDSAKFEEKETSEVFMKLFPYDADTELGVKIGTRIRVGSAEGEVVRKSAKHDHVFVKVVGREEEEVTVLFVMVHAVKGQGVTSVEGFQRNVVLFLMSVIVIVTVHVSKHHHVDGKAHAKYNVYTHLEPEIAVLEGKRCADGTFPKKRQSEMDTLKKSLGAVTKIYPMVWRVVRTISATETMRKVPASFDDDLKGFCQQPGSQLEFLGLKKFEEMKELSFDNGLMGIFGMKVIFNDKGNAKDLISTLMVALRQSFLLGRLTNIQSAVFPLRAKEFTVVASNVEFGRENLVAVKEKPNGTTDWTETSSKTRATEALLDRDDPRWFPPIPLSVIGTMTRSSGVLQSTTLDKVYTKTRKFYPLVVDALPDGDERDLPVFRKVKSYFDPIAAAFKKAADVDRNKDGQFGPSRKEIQGRMEDDPWILAPRVDNMVTALMRNAIDKVMLKVRYGLTCDSSSAFENNFVLHCRSPLISFPHSCP